MTTPIPPAALKSSSPTSRSIFRLVVGSVGSTNREADTLRHALLSKWNGEQGSGELGRQLRALDKADPDGSLGSEARLAVWFSFTDSENEYLITADDPVLSGVSNELQTRLASIERPVDEPEPDAESNHPS